MSMLLSLRITTPSEIATLRASSEMVAEWVTGTDAGDPSLIELDKTWDGLNYLLTDGNERAGEPWCFLLRGGEEIGEYASYDPVRILQPAQVKACSEALASLS
ncbi:MAG TPA: DUF1877 family protein, partial [Fimbriimonas sp.]|nr:DUF1877 family protein [Fimbriimonas sp.]